MNDEKNGQCLTAGPVPSTICQMNVVYSIEGRPFRLEGDRLWNRDGAYVAKLVDGFFYDSSGTYVGEFRNDRLGYNTRHANKHKMGHIPRIDRVGISRGDRIARTMPIGWEDFHG